MNPIFDMQSDDYHGVIDRTGFEPDCIDDDAADQHFAALDGKGRVRARCSIWWRDTVSVDGDKSGAIGHYAATGEQFGHAVLDHACRELQNRGCRIAIGPMDGNTWRRYRFVTERGTARPFFLEPDNPDEYPIHYRRAGFDVLADYVSEINTDVAERQPPLGDLRRTMAAQQVEIGPLDTENPDADLDGVYDVVTRSFARSFLYTPLDRDSYRRLYVPLIEAVDPRLMLLARQEGRVVGFVFAPPDVLQKNYQERVDAIVIKTIAILPEPGLRGLGRVLIGDLLANALDMGFTTAISALMHVGNRSTAMSGECAGPMRRYSVFGKRLSA